MTKKFHFIGIGGAGMSVIAELLAGQGFQISGSDKQDSNVLKHLRSLGISVYDKHAQENVPIDATVVVSTAIKLDNPELACARHRGQKVLHRSQALALAASKQKFVAVAGAHGKTTTSAMIFAALETCGASPSSAIGGTILGHGTGAHLGKGNIFVAEADESDGSFLNYRPNIALVTNVEPDHLDHYGSKAAFEEIFVEFAGKIVPGGTLICCAEDDGAARLARVAKEKRVDIDVWTYGRPDKCENPTITAGEFGVDSQSSWTVVQTSDDESFPIHLQVTGEHNLLNAVGAWSVGIALGIDGTQLAEGLASFSGTGRRFEFRGEVSGKRLFDDYAHHPTEIMAALKQARLIAGKGNVNVVFQPHLYSRTANFADRFAVALELADNVILTGIYAAREDPDPAVTPFLIADRISNQAKVRVIENLHSAVVQAAEITESGDILILIGAGDVNQASPEVLTNWKSSGS